MRKMKKALAAMMTATMVLSMNMTAWAATSQNAIFNKTYKITNDGTSNPEETFTFEFTADHVTDSNKNLTKAQMPKIDDSTVQFTAGEATKAGDVNIVNVALSDVVWPGVGVYYYKVNEKAGNTAGVVYDTNQLWLKVTVAYDEGTATYYTAFVTLNLADADADGKTDSKTGGFTNEYQAGSLEISKTVTGNLGDQNAYFAVKVTLTGETGKTYLDSYNVTGGSYEQNPITIKIGEETTFYLKHNETITIANLPYGVTYTVAENDYTTEANGKYDDPTYVWSDETNKKIDSEKDTVKITNNKGTVVDTGVMLDSAPYIILLAVAACGVFFVAKKRRDEEMF